MYSQYSAQFKIREHNFPLNGRIINLLLPFITMVDGKEVSKGHFDTFCPLHGSNLHLPEEMYTDVVTVVEFLNLGIPTLLIA